MAHIISGAKAPSIKVAAGVGTIFVCEARVEPADEFGEIEDVLERGLSFIPLHPLSDGSAALAEQSLNIGVGALINLTDVIRVFASLLEGIVSPHPLTSTKGA